MLITQRVIYVCSAGEKFFYDEVIELANTNGMFEVLPRAFEVHIYFIWSRNWFTNCLEYSLVKKTKYMKEFQIFVDSIRKLYHWIIIEDLDILQYG